MSFIEEIKSIFNFDETVPKYRAVLFGDSAIYLENVESIKSFTTQKIELVVKKGEIIICGENLYIKKFCGRDIAICGKIKSITN